MDSFWVIVLFILFAIFSDKKGGKKPVPKRRTPDLPQRPLPDIAPPRREKIEIPELRGAPPLPNVMTTPQVQERDAILAEQQRYQEMMRRKKRQERTAVPQEKQNVAAQTRQPAIGLNTLQQAVIWSEILGKPRAYRKK
ncbi:hypothetical protein SELR_21810 [Selenomonas ruminantium subsp. lactilytica TAM6421]|uniref:Uncharacterized protein n=1 Tax=Selenomonas ruminantium subsp. lactilytica (strain NBRC 103574 / TAM6421) TaxID=927704 RepID=I0GT02_SELRL|nr:hypothetical protein [Selenomonas ruminantium]BAL83889.1 hypothetical protein SELR_21810 [Selenomonas ruminantium subsp. lactilytica TAM6421]